MGQREDRLIGFQVINKINTGNSATFNAASYMKNEIPETEEPLICGLDEDTPKARPATVEDIKQLTETTSKIIDIEIDTRMERFMENYSDRGAVNRGLQLFSIARKDVDRDKEQVQTHKASVRNVNALVNDLSGLKDNGDLLSLYKEAVELVVSPEHLPQAERYLNTYQDVLNAIALELQGLCSYTGEIKYWSFEDRVAIVESRIRVAQRVSRYLEDTPEVRDFQAALKQLTTLMQDAVHIHDLNAIAQDPVTQVPQLPLLRRWWNFN